MSLAIEEDRLWDHLGHPGGQRYKQSGRWQWGREDWVSGQEVLFPLTNGSVIPPPVSEFLSPQQGCGLGDSSDTF